MWMRQRATTGQGAGRGEEEVPGKGRNDGKGSGGRKGGTDEDEETNGATSFTRSERLMRDAVHSRMSVRVPNPV